MDKLLKAALAYHKMGYGVIPVKKDKKPYCKWQKYQNEPADEKQIRQWWAKWPAANIGIVAGAVSGVDVVDVDSERGWSALNEWLSDTFLTPICKTPKGYHVWFKHKAGLSNGVRIITDTDLRTFGGYVIAPPSTNGAGKVYFWMDGASIRTVRPAAMPEGLFDIFLSGARQKAAPISAATKNKVKNPLEINPYIEEQTSPPDVQRRQVTSSDVTMFKKGFRDDSLFHVANGLIKGGVDKEVARKVLSMLASQCEPPFSEKEIPAKIQSALDRKVRSERSIAEEVLDFVVTSSGVFLTSDVYFGRQVTSRDDKKRVVKELLRLKEKGIIERVGERNGCYRKIESDCDPEDWKSACTDSADIWLPFDLHKIAKVPHGSLVVISGEPNAGKTAVLLNVAKGNMTKYQVHYFSSEMGNGQFKGRVSKFPDMTIDQFKVNFYQRADNFADVIKPGQGNLNIIDFIEIYDNFWLIGKELANIYKKLDGAIAVVAIQKDAHKEYGRGGSFTQEKPVLSLSLSPHKVKITKLKEWDDTKTENPNGMQYLFKLVQGCQFKKTAGWHYDVPQE